MQVLHVLLGMCQALEIQEKGMILDPSGLKILKIECLRGRERSHPLFTPQVPVSVGASLEHSPRLSWGTQVLSHPLLFPRKLESGV